jgi:hypothetical protein
MMTETNSRCEKLSSAGVATRKNRRTDRRCSANLSWETKTQKRKLRSQNLQMLKLLPSIARRGKLLNQIRSEAHAPITIMQQVLRAQKSVFTPRQMICEDTNA